MELYGTEKNLGYVAYLCSAYLTVSEFIIALAMVNNISEIQKNLRQRYEPSKEDLFVPIYCLQVVVPLTKMP